MGNILVREADRLGRLVDDFLRFARPAEPQRVTVPIGRLIRDTVEMTRSDPASQMRFHLDVEVPEIIGEVDPDQLRQVLLNLLRNAIQAAGPKGNVRIYPGAVDALRSLGGLGLGGLHP